MGASKGKGKGVYPPVVQTSMVCVNVPMGTFQAFCEGSVYVSQDGIVTVQLPVQQQKTLLAALIAPVPCGGKKSKGGKYGKGS